MGHETTAHNESVENPSLRLPMSPSGSIGTLEA